MSFLNGVTFAVNLLALILSLGLCTALVTRNPKQFTAFLTALKVWFMGAVILDALLAINPPSAINLKPAWLRYIFPFWPRETLAGIHQNRLQGWSLAPALILWHHVTVLL